jgi:hypothetical protein
MEVLRIPFVLWFSGEARPDLSAMQVPIAIPVSFHANSESMQRIMKYNNQTTAVTTDDEFDV